MFDVTVSFTRTSGGVDTECTKSLALRVVAPSVESPYPKTIGTNEVTENNTDEIMLQGGDNELVGILFQVGVLDPGGEHIGGVWQWVQTCDGVSVKCTGAGDDRSCEGFACDSGVSLDTDYPYLPESIADGTLQLANDSPFFEADPADYTTIGSVDDFKMYVMYKPPGTNSIWVALLVLNWTNNWCDVPNPDGPGWKVPINFNEADFDPWDEYPENPQWTEVTPNDGFWSEIIPTPPECEPPLNRSNSAFNRAAAMRSRLKAKGASTTAEVHSK